MTLTNDVRPAIIDWGRVAMVPLSTVLGLLAIVRIISLVRDGESGVSSLATATVTAGLSGLFYCLIIWAYLRRGPAKHTSQVRLALVVAPIATFLPFALPYAGTGTASTSAVYLGGTLLVAGLAFSIWSLRCLDRSLSVVPQARQLVDHGPYALVRHPLYLGELIAMLGLALTLGGAIVLVGWLLLVGLQCYRAVQEEALLGTALPEYDAYRRRTARVLPGLF